MPAASEEKEFKESKEYEEFKDVILSADCTKGFLLFWVLFHFS